MGEKLKMLFDFIKKIVHDCRTGCLQINFSQGGITRVDFTEKVL